MIRARVKCAFGVVILGCFVTVVYFTALARAEAPPTPEQVHFAQRTSDLMLATLFAALLQEFAETTPANVEEGKQSISLIFNDRNEDMRPVDASRWVGALILRVPLKDQKTD